MKTMTVGEFKARFSEALDAVRGGETIVVAYGRNRRKIAAMVPYAGIKQAASEMNARNATTPTSVAGSFGPMPNSSVLSKRVTANEPQRPSAIPESARRPP